MKLLRAAILTVVAVAPAAAQAPAWDNTGNGLLSGTYYFREVIYVIADNNGDLSRAIAVYGTVAFDGNGNYSISSASALDSDAGVVQPVSTTGTYSIAASGYGFFSLNLVLNGVSNVYTVYGLVSNGVFVGSSTEHGFNDMFVAAKLASPVPTVSSFRGSYNIVGFIPGAAPSGMADTSFQLNPDGAGNLGTVNISGYYGAGGSSVVTQSSAAVKYIFSNGGCKFTFPNSNTAPFYAGDEYLYMSADGNFVFGGSPSYFDMFVGVKTASGTQNFGGMYYEAGLDEDTSQLASYGYGNLDTYYGAFSANGGTIVGSERLLSVFNSSAQGFTFDSSYPSGISGMYNDPSSTVQYWVGNNGAIRIGYGIGPYLGLNVALQAPTLSGSGVYLNPAGIANAASFAPFTAGVSGGEFIVLYGSNLAASTKIASSLPFPATLNNVQVTVNGNAAPIYYVSPAQIAIIVPYGISTPIAQIQVNNNGTLSNAVTEFVNATTPGVFTLSANGLGYGAIEHANGTVVSPSSPAQPGETVAMYLSGLGAVSPSVTEGTAGPSSPLSYTTNNLSVYIGGNLACGPNSTTVSVCPFSGLAPYLAGLYQLNIPVPASATSGDNALEIIGPDSDNYQGFISVGAASAAASSIARPRPSLRHDMNRALPSAHTNPFAHKQ